MGRARRASGLIRMKWDLTESEKSSLRANGSRECAPDDRLREAIQKLKKQTGLLPPRAPPLRRTRTLGSSDSERRRVVGCASSQ